ncbi:MAG: hypothetical protein ABIK43_02615 [candidate division WOR-3 bacterium]
MKISHRIVVYLVLGLVFLAAWLPLHVMRFLRRPSLLMMSGVFFTIAIAFILLAGISRLEAKVRAIEDSLRVTTCRERSRVHDRDAPEPEPPEQAS